MCHVYSIHQGGGRGGGGRGGRRGGGGRGRGFHGDDRRQFDGSNSESLHHNRSTPEVTKGAAVGTQTLCIPSRAYPSNGFVGLVPMSLMASVLFPWFSRSQDLAPARWERFGRGQGRPAAVSVGRGPCDGRGEASRAVHPGRDRRGEALHSLLGIQSHEHASG